MKRHLCGIERDTASGTEASGIGMNTSKVVKPKRRFIVARIVLDKGELRPTHRPVVPTGRRRRCPCGKQVTGNRGRYLYERATIHALVRYRALVKKQASGLQYKTDLPDYPEHGCPACV